LVLQIFSCDYIPSVSAVIVALLVLINVISLGAFALDKQKAIQGKWRIPEKILLVLAGIGGAAGALFAMKLFHHKTRHPKFSIGIPVLLILQIIVAILVILLFL
jgi:uncharacterized membrane protein YsdA (DUF1294 family)